MPGRDIFLSYSSEDDAIVRLALEKLEAAGHRCWFAPRDIPPGEFYAGQIIQALRESRFVLLFFSIHSNASEQVVREINFAVGQRLPMLVVRLNQTALSNDFEYLIRINQWLDLTHLSSDAERAAQIVSKVRASLDEAGSKTAKAPVAMIFGDFEILADSSGKPIELGRGGMGVTYRARQISMGREVALKVIQPEHLGDDNVRRRFLREARLAGEIGHENVAPVHLRGQEGDSYFYAMELVEGIDLDRYVKANGPLSVRDALSVTAQVASALTAANAKGLIHRDIKPSNLMAVRRRNTLRIKLIDFGLAKQITQQDIHNSLSGKDEFKGTLAYASPEQCQAFPLDTRSDLYSLGITLWFLLSGKVPFTGTLAAVSGAHIWAPLPLQQLPPLPEAVLELLQSLLAKKPEGRPQTPEEVEDRAEALLRSLRADSVSGSETPLQFRSAAFSDACVEPEDNSTLIGAPVLISYLGPAVGQVREDRFELLEALREGVSGRLFRARERRGSDSRIVAIKFLHPSICEQEEATESLRTQFAALQRLTLDHLLRYFALELGSEPPFLVREWIHGLPLTGVLRLKAGTLTPPEVSTLLEPLPGLLDGLASSGLSLVTVRLSKLWARFPPDLEPAKFESWVKQLTAEDWDSRLALDPLSLRSLVSRLAESESDMTLLPTSRSLALQQNRAGIQGRTPAQLLASVVYELLGGQPPQSQTYRPLAAIPDNANQRLKQALAHEGPDQLTASELWLALKADLAEAPKAPAKPSAAEQRLEAQRRDKEEQQRLEAERREAAAKERLEAERRDKKEQQRLEAERREAAAKERLEAQRRDKEEPTPTYQPPPKPAPSTVSTPPNPAKPPTKTQSPLTLPAIDFGTLKAQAKPPTKPESPLTRDHSRPEETYQTPLLRFYGAVAVFMCFILLAYWFASHSKFSIEKGSPEPTASQTPTPAPSPEPSVSPTATATPTPAPSNDELARAAFERGYAAAGKGDLQTAIDEYSEAIRLTPGEAAAFNNRGIAYAALTQYDKAIADYSEAIRLKPDLQIALNNRGNAYYSLKQYEKAIADYSEAIRLKPDNSGAFYNRGNAYFDLKQYNKAITDFSEAIRLKPDYAYAYDRRALCYDELGNKVQAQRDREMANKLAK
jgi:serine/threonine protein kinase/Flp pilus assembly protein TadD